MNRMWRGLTMDERKGVAVVLALFVLGLTVKFVLWV